MVEQNLRLCQRLLLGTVAEVDGGHGTCSVLRCHYRILGVRDVQGEDIAASTDLRVLSSLVKSQRCTLLSDEF